MNCNIIKDLIVLYESGECSEESKAAILEHVASCPACAAVWKSIEKKELDAAIESEKESEFQQITKEIQKENKKHTLRTEVIVALSIVMIFVIGTIIAERNNPVTKASNVTTGTVVYWETDQRNSFQYDGKKYTSMDAEELAKEAFDGKALRYFYYHCNEELLRDRENAAFNVQDDKQGPLDNLLLNNNRSTMHRTNCPVVENLYASSFGWDFFMPVGSEKILNSYYGDLSNYSWGLYEWLLDKEDNSLIETDRVELELTKEDVTALAKVVTAPVVENTIDWEGDQVNADDSVELEMTSKDGVLFGRMGINKYGGEWYTRAYVYNEGEGESYITAKLPKSIGDKIDALLGQTEKSFYQPVDKDEKLKTW